MPRRPRNDTSPVSESGNSVLAITPVRELRSNTRKQSEISPELMVVKINDNRSRVGRAKSQKKAPRKKIVNKQKLYISTSDEEESDDESIASKQKTEKQKLEPEDMTAEMRQQWQDFWEYRNLTPIHSSINNKPKQLVGSAETAGQPRSATLNLRDDSGGDNDSLQGQEPVLHVEPTPFATNDSERALAVLTEHALVRLLSDGRLQGKFDICCTFPIGTLVAVQNGIATPDPTIELRVANKQEIDWRARKFAHMVVMTEPKRNVKTSIKFFGRFIGPDGNIIIPDALEGASEVEVMSWITTEHLRNLKAGDSIYLAQPIIEKRIWTDKGNNQRETLQVTFGPSCKETLQQIFFVKPQQTTMLAGASFTSFN